MYYVRVHAPNNRIVEAYGPQENVEDISRHGLVKDSICHLTLLSQTSYNKYFVGEMYINNGR